MRRFFFSPLPLERHELGEHGVAPQYHLYLGQRRVLVKIAKGNVLLNLSERITINLPNRPALRYQPVLVVGVRGEVAVILIESVLGLEVVWQ